MTQDELEQRLWELEYGLLPDSEAEELRRQLAADEQLANRHRQVLSQLRLVSQASKVDARDLEFRVPREDTDAPAEVASPPVDPPVTTENPFQPGHRSVRIWRRIGNWGTALAASWLLVTLAWTASPRSAPKLAEQSPPAMAPGFSLPRATLSETDVFISVAAPQRVHRDASVPLAIQTRHLDGSPQSVELEAEVRYGAGPPILAAKLKTDGRGRGYVTMPSESLDSEAPTVLSFYRQQSPPVEVTLSPAREEYVTRLATDKPRYRPGDTVRFRSVTLSRFGLRADREFPTEHFATDPQGTELAGTRTTVDTNFGVSSGEFTLAPAAAAGRYSLFVRSSDEAFPAARADFDVVVARERRFQANVTWFKRAFGPNETVRGELQLQPRGDQPASEVSVQLQAFIDGREVTPSSPTAATNADGRREVLFTAPALITAATGELGVRIPDHETLWLDIPLEPNQVVADFYPEGGDLTADVANRVYFHAHDADGRAVAVTGKLVNEANQEVAEVRTIRDGRGLFSFQPTANERYALQVVEPATMTTRIPLPPVVPESFLVLNAGAGVFSPDEPLRLELHSRAIPPDFAYSVVARCRGVTVGQLSGVGADFRDGVCPVELPVIPETSGVVRVTVFDHSGPEPHPLAERLVYRRPARQLRIHFDAWPDQYSPDGSVKGTILATDEAGKPVSAALGVAVLDDGVLTSAPTPPARLPAQFQLLGDLDNAEQLEDANFYLEENTEASVSLDLLLGTQGWRRFDRVPVSRLALNVGSQVDAFAFGGENLNRLGLDRKAGDSANAAPAAGLAGANQDLTPQVLDPSSTKRFGEQSLDTQLAGNEFAVQLVRDAVDDAPHLADNRRMLSETIREKNDLGYLDSSSLDPGRETQPRGTAERAGRWSDLSSAPLRIGAWWVGLALLAMALSLRWRPRLSTLLTSFAVVGGLLLFTTVWIVAQPHLGSAPQTAVSARSGATGGVVVPESPVEYRVLPATEDLPDKTDGYHAPPSAEPTLQPRAEAMAPSDAAAAPLPPAAPAPASEPPPAPVSAPAAAPAPAAALPPAEPSRPLARPGALPAERNLQSRGATPPAADPAPVPPPAPRAATKLLQEQLEAKKAGAPDGKLAEKPGLQDLDKSAWMATERFRRLKTAAENVVGEERKRELAETESAPKRGGAEAQLFQKLDLPELRNVGQTRSKLPAGSVEELRASPAKMLPAEDKDRSIAVRYFANTNKRPERSAPSDTEVLFWHPLLVTDREGRATVEFTAPQVRAPYRVLVDGHEQGRVGTASRLLAPAP